jgi:hypothetical protein
VITISDQGESLPTLAERKSKKSLGLIRSESSCSSSTITSLNSLCISVCKKALDERGDLDKKEEATLQMKPQRCSIL